jgi:glycosyltransferase involved in cell wall biosynthesis
MKAFFPGAKVIGNSYDTDIFLTAEHDHHGRGNILFVGRLVALKGCDILIRAFAEVASALPDVGLSVVGDGEQLQSLQHLARILNVADRVHFLGGMEADEVARAMRRHSVLVVPSWYEPFGIVVLEGLASGCEVVAARSGGLPEAVGMCGYLFEPGDVADLGVKIRDALLQGHRGRRAHVQKHLRAFSPDAIARQYLALLGGLVSRRQ